MKFPTFIKKIGVLTILGAILGAMYADTQGAIIGAVVGFMLDQKFG